MAGRPQKDKANKLEARVVTDIPLALKEKLEAEANRRGLSMSFLMRQAITDYLEVRA
jgi:predicted transcriptional regulator